MEARKATDVLLALETKIETLTGVVRSQDLNIKILSNKLNEVIAKLQSSPAPKPMAEVPDYPKMPPQPAQPIDPERHILIEPENNLPMTDSPQGFRRTSRPESFSGDNVYLNQTKPSQSAQPQPPNNVPKFPVQTPVPPGRTAGETFDFPQVPEPAQRTIKQIMPDKQAQVTGKQTRPLVQNAIPVIQRIVDKGGKSVFMADVEIVDTATAQPVFKGRTNGMGKWMASLGVGVYQVSIRKKANDQKEKIEANQEITIDGSKSPLELQTMIVR